MKKDLQYKYYKERNELSVCFVPAKGDLYREIGKLCSCIGVIKVFRKFNLNMK